VARFFFFVPLVEGFKAAGELNGMSPGPSRATTST
jgi:hypothetical protein